MKIAKPSYEILTPFTGDEVINIARIGRVCWQSKGNGTRGCEEEFVRRLIKMGHESVLEHGNISVKFICDRDISHQIVRHRHCAFSQETTRIDYQNKDGGITVIKPVYLTEDTVPYHIWEDAMTDAEEAYYRLRTCNIPSAMARSVLPHDLKTEIVVTTNYREWRTIFKLRTNPNAHIQMRELMIPLLEDMQERLPVIFEDIKVSEVARIN